jgi:PBP1b-binding outer membrane lipoprotein LpoB
MRNYLVATILIILLVSCSSSKNNYRDFNSSQYSKSENRSSGGEQNVDKYPLKVNTSFYTASRSNSVLPLVNIKDIKTKEADEASKDVKRDELSAEAARRKELSKIQRREFRKAMRESMRRYVMPTSKKETKRRQVGG